MQWYYAREGTRFGPVTEEEFSRLVHEGAIGPDTLVWREGMEDWREFRQVTSGAEAVSGPAFCSQCGRTFPEEEMIQYGGVHICAGLQAHIRAEDQGGGGPAGHHGIRGFLDSFRSQGD